MAKVAAAGPLPPSSTLQFGGGSKVTATKRKTPSELRGEMLKQKNVMELIDESPTPVLGSKRQADDLGPGCKKDSTKVPRYIDTRVNELFPVRKNSIRLRLLCEKEIVKDIDSAEHVSSLKNSSVSPDLAAKSQPQVLDAAEKHSNSTFLSVTELSSGGQNLSKSATLDMDKALKGLVAHEPPSVSLPESFEKNWNFKAILHSSDFTVPGKKNPLDLTLKTTMRIVSSSSVNWFHRVINCGILYHNSLQLGNLAVTSQDQDVTYSPGLSPTSGFGPRGLYSWVYPQSPLPASVISALSLSLAEGGGQMNFLSNRRETWEHSFRNLYYMLRKKICNIFYVCTTQFVVMFTASDSPKSTKRTCHGYISQSTRGLRSLLREHDVCYSMPLCRSKMEEIATDNLIELSELDKHNSGQDQHFVSMSDLDNTPQSLLMFAGNQSVHGLYDFLLNHRSFLISLIDEDVPILYSPVAFENAALTAPEVRCREVRQADHMHFPSPESNISSEANQGSSHGMCYSVEIKSAYLPPWAISSICDVLRSNGISFEASFTTQPTSIGLNVGLDVISQDSKPEGARDDPGQNDKLLGVPNVTLFPLLRSAFLKGLKYGSDSYTALLSHV